MALSDEQRKAASLLVQRDLNGMTFAEIAQNVGVTERTIRNWRNDKEFIKHQNEVAENVMESYIPELYTELRGIMKTGSENVKLKAIELAMRNRGKLRQETEIKVEVSQKTNEELEAEIEQMLNRSKL